MKTKNIIYTAIFLIFIFVIFPSFNKASAAGVCGSVNGTSITSAPVTNLCSTGVSSKIVTTSHGWRWTCNDAINFITGANANDKVCPQGSTLTWPDCYVGDLTHKVSCSVTKSSVNKKVVTPVVTSHKSNGGIVPSCSGAGGSCNFDDLMILINNIINFLLVDIATPLAAIAFAYAGFLLLTAGGDPGKVTQAKAIIRNVLIGLVIALAAWLIINTIFTSLGFTHSFLTK